MKKKFIIPGIWLVVLIISILLANFIISLIIDNLDASDTLIKYSERGEYLINPESSFEDLEESKQSAVMSLRSLLDDSRAFLFENTLFDVKKDLAVVFLTKEGENRLSNGVWTIAYKDHEGEIQPIKDSIGLISVNQMANTDYCDQLLDALKKDKNSKVKLDKYIFNQYVVTPVSIRVIESDGNTVLSLEDSSLINDANVIEADDVYLYHAYEEDDIFDNADYDLTNTLALVKENRYVDERVDQLIDTIKFDNNSTTSEYTVFRDIKKATIGKYTIEKIGVAGNYAMVLVCQYTYLVLVLIIDGVFALVWTIIMGTIFCVTAKKSKKKQ